MILLLRLLFEYLLIKQGADWWRIEMLFMECQSGRDHSFLKCPLKILFTQLGLRVICEVMAEAWTQALTIHFLFSTWLCIFYLPLSLVGYLSPSAHGTPTHLLCPLSPRP